MLHSAEFWVAVSFLIFVAAAGRTIYRQLTTALDARAAGIKAQLDEATALRDEAQALLASYQRKQRDAMEEAEGIVTQAREDAERVRQETAGTLEKTLARRRQQAVDKITQAEQEALRAVRDQAVDLAIAATAHLVSEKLNEGTREKLVEAAISELQEKLPREALH